MFTVEFPEHYTDALRLGVLVLLVMFQLSILLIVHYSSHAPKKSRHSKAGN
jgi:hypothetical protein